MARRLVLTKEVVGNLTVGELEMLEERTGRPLSRLFDPDAPRGSLLHALAYITLRREDDPDITWEQAADVIVTLVDPDAAEVVETTAENPMPAGRAKRRA